jgi:LmbE family N-acetylglucosaminyl deacetylase
VDLGALLYVFRRAGADLALLSVTRGEGSPLNSTCEKLASVRPWELHAAAGVLGISSVAVADFPDGRLSGCPVVAITERVEREIGRHAPDLVLTVDPVTGGPDEAVVGQAVLASAGRAGVPALARGVPGACGGWLTELGADSAKARAIQRSAAAAHASQAEAMPAVRRHLNSLRSSERLRWLVPRGPIREPQALGRVSVI